MAENFRASDDIANRVGMATGQMQTCPTCGKPQNPKKPHKHPEAGKPETVPLGTGIANIGKQTILDAKKRRQQMLKDL